MTCANAEPSFVDEGVFTSSTITRTRSARSLVHPGVDGADDDADVNADVDADDDADFDADVDVDASETVAHANARTKALQEHTDRGRSGRSIRR
jgi:hypothetical protein